MFNNCYGGAHDECKARNRAESSGNFATPVLKMNAHVGGVLVDRRLVDGGEFAREKFVRAAFNFLFI